MTTEQTPLKNFDVKEEAETRDSSAIKPALHQEPPSPSQDALAKAEANQSAESGNDNISVEDLDGKPIIKSKQLRHPSRYYIRKPKKTTHNNGKWTDLEEEKYKQFLA